LGVVCNTPHHTTNKQTNKQTGAVIGAGRQFTVQAVCESGSIRLVTTTTHKQNPNKNKSDLGAAAKVFWEGSRPRLQKRKGGQGGGVRRTPPPCS